MKRLRPTLPLVLLLLLSRGVAAQSDGEAPSTETPAAEAPTAPAEGHSPAQDLGAETALDDPDETGEATLEDATESSEESSEGSSEGSISQGLDEGLDAGAEALDEATDTVLEQVIGEIPHEAYEPTEADVPPPRLDEVPTIPDEVSEPIEVLEEDEAWVPELTLSAGVYFREDVAPGIWLGASTRVVEYGPATRRTEGRGSYRERRIFARIDAEFGIAPGEGGLDEMRLELGAFARRRETEAADGSERSRTDVTILPVRLRRSVELDRRIAVSASILAADAWREVQLREQVFLGIRMRVSALGFTHISYAQEPLLHFNGVHLAGVGFDVEPTFGLGPVGYQFRYVLGGSADLALGARDGKEVGARFTTVGDLEAHSGFGFDFGPHVSWDTRAAYHGSVDSQRDNPTGWRVFSFITGRY